MRQSKSMFLKKSHPVAGFLFDVHRFCLPRGSAFVKLIASQGFELLAQKMLDSFSGKDSRVTDSHLFWGGISHVVNGRGFVIFGRLHEANCDHVTTSIIEFTLTCTGWLGRLKKTLSAKNLGVGIVRFMHEPSTVICASSLGSEWDQSLRYWSLPDNRYIRYLKGHRGKVGICICVWMMHVMAELMGNPLCMIWWAPVTMSWFEM